MHRVVNLNSYGYNVATIDGCQFEIIAKLDTYNPANIHDRQVNDGQNEEGNPTLGVSVDFNNATDANDFHDWLKQYITDRSADFSQARTRVHDCYHAADLNLPCEIGDVWELA